VMTRPVVSVQGVSVGRGTLTISGVADASGRVGSKVTTGGVGEGNGSNVAVGVITITAACCLESGANGSHAPTPSVTHIRRNRGKRRNGRKWILFGFKTNFYLIVCQKNSIRQVRSR
jgi:hypothetical protein